MQLVELSREELNDQIEVLKKLIETVEKAESTDIKWLTDMFNEVRMAQKGDDISAVCTIGDGEIAVNDIQQKPRSHRWRENLDSNQIRITHKTEPGLTFERFKQNITRLIRKEIEKREATKIWIPLISKICILMNIATIIQRSHKLLSS